MKYFYAIVTCNSKETALFLYDEFNGFEFEHTSIKLNMSLVPDSIVFEQEVKQEATKVPPNYNFEFVQQRYSRALGHSKVTLTWDQTDPNRTRKLREGFTCLDPNDPEAEAAYYKEFIAGSSDEEDDNVSKNSAEIEEYRKKLLSGLTNGDGKQKKKEKKSLEFDDIDWDNVNPDDFDSDDLDQIEANKEKKKGGPDIKFTSGFGEDVGKKLLKNKQSKQDEAKMTPFEKY